MCPLDGTRGSTRDQTHDSGRDSLACGGKWETTNSASRVDAALFFSPSTCYISAAVSQIGRLGGSPQWAVTALLSPVWFSTGREETGQAGPYGHLERLQEDWKGTKRPLDANPTSGRQPARHPTTLHVPHSSHMQEVQPSHSCRGTTPLTDTLEVETWARRRLPSEGNTELTASSAGQRSAQCGAIKTWKVK